MAVKVEHLLDALGIEAEPGDKTHDAVVNNNPTIKAFIAGEITFAEAVFIETYLANGFNHKRAAAAAKYRATTAGGHSAVGRNLLGKEKIRSLLAERLSTQVMQTDEILARYRDVAEGNLGEFVSIHGGEPTLDMTEAEDKLHLLKEIKFGKDGEVNIKMRDPDHALDQLARSAGVFEKDHTLNLPPELLAMVTMTPEERKQREQAYDAMDEWNDGDEPQEEAGEPNPAP